jgi:DNA-binding LacI/PurR family transcriptional regulator
LFLKRLRIQILKKEKVTLKFLAKKLGLDISTVSKALNNKPDIAKSTCERVKKFAEDVGYRPNLLAKGLINKRTHMLGVIIPDLRLSFYSQVLEGIQQSAEENGYMPILLLNDDNELIERKNLEFFASLPVDGILIDAAPGRQNISLMNNITHQGIPLIFYDRYIREVKSSRVTIDDISASYDLTMSLIKSGKRRIAYMGPTEGMSVAHDRFHGYKKALSAAKIAFDEQLVMRCKIDETDSKLHILNLLKKGIVPDGMVCMGGLVALGAGETLLNAGYKIPDDFLLAEFGDNDIVAKLGVPYRSINQSPFEIGKSAVNLIREEIERNRDIDDFRHVIIPSTLIEH